MKILLSPRIIKELPNIKYKVILINHIDNRKRVSGIAQLLRGTEVVVKNELKKASVKDFFNNMIDKGKVNNESLLETYLLQFKIKKLQSGKSLETADALCNLIEYISIRKLLPIFAVDLDKLEKDLPIELYEPKKGKKTPDYNFDGSTNIVALFFPDMNELEENELESIYSEIDMTFQKYIGGEIASIYELSSENQVIDLGYVSKAESELLNSFIPKDEFVSLKKKPRLMDLKEILKQSLFDVVQNFLRNGKIEVFSDSFNELKDMIQVEKPANESHGDLSSNVALKIAEKFSLTPLELAKAICEEMQKDQTFKSVEVKGPGFINFYFSDGVFIERLNEIIEMADDYGNLDIGNNEKIMVDFGSLNAAKPFGAHHLPTTVIGKTLVSLLNRIGFQSYAVDFPGDWGTQFGKLIYAIKNYGNKAQIEENPMRELLKIYVKFHEEAEKNPILEDEARKEFKKMCENDRDNIEIWEWITLRSKKDMDRIYQTLGVKHDFYLPESKYINSSAQIVEEGLENGVFIQGEDKAIISDLNSYGLGMVPVRKSDGTTLYITRDLASIKDRIKIMPDVKKLIYVVDSAQTLHFKQLFKIAELMGIAKGVNLCHVAYGRMSFVDGSMSTRKGNIVFAEDVIEESLKKAGTMMDLKSPELPENEKKNAKQAMAIGAIKYAMINHSPESDWVFDWNKIMTFDGDSAPYLQYACARAKSILTKAKEHSVSFSNTAQIDLFSMTEEQKVLEEDAIKPFEKEKEIVLIKTLIRFPEKLEMAANCLKPNILTSYLIELAKDFNAFYASVPVLNAQKEDLFESRIKLVRATVIVLTSGLKAINIPIPERM